MPFATEHAARIRRPSDFEQGSFRRVNNKFDAGVHGIFGKVRGEKTVSLQAIRFNASAFSPEKAREWLDDHDYKNTPLELASKGDSQQKDSAPGLSASGVFSQESVPTEMLRCSVCELSLGEGNGEGAKSSPLKIKARGGAPISHPYWGMIAHDMKGMRLNGGRVAVDYNHDPKEMIGYLNHFDISTGDLNASGALVPYKDSDRATEVIHKSKAGIPYEASIYFGGDILMEKVDDGDCAEVNGQTFVGPGTILRQWQLRGVAVCPYGADSNTHTQLSETGSQTVVKFIDGKLSQLEEQAMANDEKQAEEAAAKLAAEVEEKAKQAEAERLAAVDANKKNDPVEQVKERARMFKAEFGTKGVEWFLADMTYEQAQKQYAAELKAENEALRKEVTELKSAPVVGGVKPVAAGAPVVEADEQVKSFSELVDEQVAAMASKGLKTSRTEAMRAVAQAHPEAYARTRGGKR